MRDVMITFKAFVQTAGHLEELIKVRSAVQDSLKGIIVSQLQIEENELQRCA